MDINSIFIRFKSTQNEDGSVTCRWDFTDAIYVDSEDEEHPITPDIFGKIVLYAPDPANPLFTQFPKELTLEEDGKRSDTYKSPTGHFTIWGILEIVRSFVEKIYNEKYDGGRYTFNDLYFSGLHGMCGMFEIDWESAGETTMNTLENLEQLMWEAGF
jgi:hypothetical protein